MKKLISLILCCLICGITSAQLIKQKVEKQKKQSELDWYNCSFDRDSVYGAEVNKAYEYLNANKKKLKKRPIVALIGTGMDVEHEDLRQAIWINPKEKLNQKDDDRNGLIDDINGWNFLGGKDAQVVESLTREGEREFFRLKDKYAQVRPKLKWSYDRYQRHHSHFLFVSGNRSSHHIFSDHQILLSFRSEFYAYKTDALHPRSSYPPEAEN